MADKVLTYVVKMDIGEGEQKVSDFRATLKTLEKSEEELSKETKQLAKTLSEKLGTSVDANIDKSNSYKSSVRDTARETSKSNREVVNISREYELLAAKVGKTSDEQQILNAQFRLGAGATDAQKSKIESLIKTYQRQRDAANQVQGSMRGLRGQAQNFGYQIQDVAVQAQMGTNALVILGQQGSQLAAGFGATGALIGAGIAIGAAAIGALAPSLMDSKSELDKFNASADKTKEIMTMTDGEWGFSDAIREISEVSKIAAESLKRINIIELSQSLSKGGSAAVSELEDLTRKWYRLDNYITQSESLSGKGYSQESRKVFLALKEASNQLKAVQGDEEIRNYISALDDLQASFQGELPEETNNFIKQQLKMAAGMLQARRQLAASSKGFEEQEKAISKSNESVDKYVQSLSEEIAKLSISEDKQNEYKASLVTTDPAMRKVITNLLDMKDKKEADIQATKDATKAQEEYWKTLVNGKQSLARDDDPIGDFIRTREQQLDAQYKKDVERVDAYYAMEAISFEQAMAKRDELWSDYNEKKKAYVDSNESVDKYVQSLSEEIAKLSISEDKQNEYKASLVATDPAMRKVITNLLDMKDKKEADIQATKDATKAQEEYWKTLVNGKQSLARDDDPIGDFIKTREQKLDAQYKKDVERVDAYYAMEAISFEQAIAKRDELWSDYNEKKKAYIDSNDDVWDQWVKSSQKALENTDQLMFESVDRFVSGTADAFASSIVHAESLGDAMKNVFAGALQSMLAYFAELAIQQALMWAFQKSGETTAKTEYAVSQMNLNQAAVFEAGLNAYKSTAAIPVVGAALAPTAMGKAIATTQPIAATANAFNFAGALDKGGLIPAGSAGIVSEFGDELVGGTMVYNGSPNSLKVTGREDTARMTGGGGGNQYFTVNSNGNASPDAIARAIARTLKKPNKQVDNAVYGSMNRGRKNGGKRFA